MASAIIHLAIAKNLRKHLNIDNEKDYYLGAIAPDIAKQIGERKEKSHFIYNTEEDVPNINLFTTKYKNFKNNSFELGYYIHLITDKIWFEDFLPHITFGNSLKLLDGTIINTTPEEIQRIIYSDYTNINIEVIDEYQMDLSLFYEEFQKPITNIDEIPIEKLHILIDKMGLIIENSKTRKSYTFDMIEIKEFIENTTKYILEKIKKY